MTIWNLARESMKELDGGLMEDRIFRKAEKMLILFTLKKGIASS